MYFAVENKSKQRLAVNQPSKSAAIEVAFGELATRSKSVASKQLTLNLYKSMNEEERVGFLRAKEYEVVLHSAIK